MWRCGCDCGFAKFCTSCCCLGVGDPTRAGADAGDGSDLSVTAGLSVVVAAVAVLMLTVESGPVAASIGVDAGSASVREGTAFEYITALDHTRHSNHDRTNTLVVWQHGEF